MPSHHARMHARSPCLPAHGWWRWRRRGGGGAGRTCRYHLTQKVPYWAGRPEVEAWQQQQRENDELQTQLPLVAGALEGAVELHGIVPIVAYITIRPQAVLQGTRVWLRAHGFPDAPILGKPDAVPFSGGNAWKGALLPRLLPQVGGGGLYCFGLGWAGWAGVGSSGVTSSAWVHWCMLGSSPGGRPAPCTLCARSCVCAHAGSRHPADGLA